MQVKVESRQFRDLVVLAHEFFQDDRGFFLESYREDVFRELGLPTTFPQDNHSRSAKNVIRGLHFQWDPPIGKLMRVTFGRAFVVAVDIRKGSPTLGQWTGMELSAQDKKQVWAPAGFARGFCALSDFAEVQYKCTGIYNNKTEGGLVWNDPSIGIKWPVTNPILSAKDAAAQTLDQWLNSPNSAHFKY
ncbi:MAG TPA: dTDP-4-dehydrorhamnose 3,5-epimerase [Bacteroidota bacterium]|jgi:dTDP-4-dehydrorhamnose 3,5-epimerase